MVESEVSLVGSLVTAVIGGALIGWSIREYWTGRKKD